MYVPAQADSAGWGGEIRREFEEWISAETRVDDWLAANPPTIVWQPNGVMPLVIDGAEPIVEMVLVATQDVGAPGVRGGLDSWYDGATLTLAGIPAVGFGPPGFDQNGVSIAHVIDEYVPVDGLVRCAQALAVAAMRFCGTVDG
jgi:acetylornithine deacetylase